MFGKPVTHDDVGARVRRGPGWGWADQDCDEFGNPTIGTIIKKKHGADWCVVRWDSGYINNYPIYDAHLVYEEGTFDAIFNI